MARTPWHARSVSSRFRLVAAIFLMLVVIGAGLTGMGPDDHDHEDGPLSFLDHGESEEVTLHDSDLVTVEDQRSDGTTVTVQEATLSDGGFLVVHDANRLDENATDLAGSVIGVSPYLEPDTYEQATVPLFDVPGRSYETDELTDDTEVFVSLHYDTNETRRFEYVTSETGSDGPYVNDTGAVHVDFAVVSVESESESG